MKEKFKEIEKQYPGASTFVCFELLIKNKKMTQEQILPLFNKFVDKDDYMGCDKVHLLEWLEKYSFGKVNKTAKLRG